MLNCTTGLLSFVFEEPNWTLHNFAVVGVVANRLRYGTV